jgi:hypothetical protein
LIYIVTQAETDPEFAELPAWAKGAILAPILGDVYRSSDCDEITPPRWRKRSEHDRRDESPGFKAASGPKPRRSWLARAFTRTPEEPPEMTF